MPRSTAAFLLPGAARGTQAASRWTRRARRALVSIPLAAGAIVSSGDYERYFEIEGQRYSHLLHPRTGWPVQGLRAVSVVAPQCLIAGTASTIAMLKGAEQGSAWLRQLGLRHLCVDAEEALSGIVDWQGAVE